MQHVLNIWLTLLSTIFVIEKQINSQWFQLILTYNIPAISCRHHSIVSFNILIWQQTIKMRFVDDKWANVLNNFRLI